MLIAYCDQALLSGHGVGVGAFNILRDGHAYAGEEPYPVGREGAVGRAEVHRCRGEDLFSVFVKVGVPDQLAAVLLVVVGEEREVVATPYILLGVGNPLVTLLVVLEPLDDEEGIVATLQPELLFHGVERIASHTVFEGGVNDEGGVGRLLEDGYVDVVDLSLIAGGSHDSVGHGGGVAFDGIVERESDKEKVARLDARRSLPAVD